MIPVGKNRGRKRRIRDEQEPLKQKPTNIRKRSGFDKSVRFIGDTNSVGGQVDKYVKQSVKEANNEVCFVNDHVSLRLTDVKEQSDREEEEEAQRLIVSPNTSLQITDFDVPPESTSTPLPSPEKLESSSINQSREVRYSPIYQSTNYNLSLIHI